MLVQCSRYIECLSKVCTHKQPHEPVQDENAISFLGEFGDLSNAIEPDCTQEFCDEAVTFGIGEAICLPVN
jgi:hypothetical protein